MRDFSEILRQLRKEKKFLKRLWVRYWGSVTATSDFTKAGNTGLILMACCNWPTTFRYHWTIW